MRRWTWRSLSQGTGIFLLGWIALALIINRRVMPYPWEVIPLFFEDFFGVLGVHLLASTLRVLAGVLLAVAFAVPIGLVLGQSRVLNRFFDPLLAIVYPIPKVAFFPVILVLFGLGDESKVFLIALILFFQVLIVVRDQAASLRPELLLSVRSLGAGRRALFRYVYLPASTLAVLTALRISVGTAIAVLFFTETRGTQVGLGYYIVVRTAGTLRYPEMYSGILAMALLGLTLYFLIDMIEQRLSRWQQSE